MSKAPRRGRRTMSPEQIKAVADRMPDHSVPRKFGDPLPKAGGFAKPTPTPLPDPNSLEVAGPSPTQPAREVDPELEAHLSWLASLPDIVWMTAARIWHAAIIERRQAMESRWVMLSAATQEHYVAQLRMLVLTGSIPDMLEIDQRLGIAITDAVAAAPSI